MVSRNRRFVKSKWTHLISHFSWPSIVYTSWPTADPQLSRHRLPPHFWEFRAWSNPWGLGVRPSVASTSRRASALATFSSVQARASSRRRFVLVGFHAMIFFVSVCAGQPATSNGLGLFALASWTVWNLKPPLWNSSPQCLIAKPLTLRHFLYKCIFFIFYTTSGLHSTDNFNGLYILRWNGYILTQRREHERSIAPYAQRQQAWCP